ncbi:MAG: YgiQ family radical SAM protein [Planctomycetes bacterium]|nr:YgiQ family radical SAM protein [Planctomycetota bacterium]
MVTNAPNASFSIALDQFAPKVTPPLPMSRQEMLDRGWDSVDVVFVSGDAYVDHPAFAAGILCRLLEAHGFRVGVLAQPDWQSCEPWKTFGKPNLFFAISAGNMDSMINHYTASRKVRNDDAYSPGGRIGLRPDRATKPYCQRAREAYKGVPIIAGGVEASLRRLAHYDYWSDKVMRSILLDAKANLIAYGMGEDAIIEIAQRLTNGESTKDMRNMRGVAYVCGASESPPSGADVVVLPTYDEVLDDHTAFARATRLYHLETSPFNAKTLVQYHDRQAVVVNPPRLPVSQGDMDRYYDLPFTRKAHASYDERIPAYEVVKDSVTIMRGCFGGCTFCSITMHQGRTIQSRSKDSIIREVKNLTTDKHFKGVISDIGGPTANMYEMRCTKPEVEAKCRRLSCVHPTVCKLLGTDHKPLIDVMRESRQVKGIKKVFVASGVRMDLAQQSPEYMEELTRHHVGGHLKVAPEHTDPTTLRLMKKPDIDDFAGFAESFAKASKKAGKKQYLVPYFIASHPGSSIESMIHLAIFLKQNGYRPDQVQDFIPAPMDIATCMYHTGIDPMSMKPVFIAKHLRDRKYQRALMQFFKPENYFLVRQALINAGRSDLIGDGCDALIPTHAPKAAILARRQQSNRNVQNEDHYHSTDREKKLTAGYRPGRSTARRQRRPKRDR